MRFIKISKKFFLSLLFGLSLAAGFSFAWNAVWHGTDWIQSGKTISSKEIAENFEYLYKRLPATDSGACQEGDILKYDDASKSYICYRCQAGDTLTWTVDGISCYTAPRFCKLRYKLIDSNGVESDWAETPFGGEGNGNWVYGPYLTTSYLGSSKLKVGIFCDNSTHKMGYKIRGNRGPYWNSGMTVIEAIPGQWVDGVWSGTGSYSCSIRGGDGACGSAVKDYVSNGCTTLVELVDNRGRVSTDTGTETTKTRAVTRGYAKLRMGIKCSN